MNKQVYRKYLCLMLLVISVDLCAEVVLQIQDFEDLVEAIELANQTEDLVYVHISQSVQAFDFREDLPSIKGELIITGYHVFGEVRHSVPIFEIEKTGSLKLRNVIFEDISVESALSAPLILNAGQLVIDSGLFNDISGACAEFGGIGGLARTTVCYPLIVNSGNLKLNQVVFEKISTHLRIVIQESHILDSVVISNRGGSAILNQVVINNMDAQSQEQDNIKGKVIPSILHSTGYMKITNSKLTGKIAGVQVKQNAGLEIANSIIDFDQDNCIYDSLTAIQSLGSNLSSDLSCGFNAMSDINGVASGLIEKTTGVFGESSGLDGGSGIAVTVPSLAASSPAIDNGLSEFCESGVTDIFSNERNIDGNHDGIARCDSGAVEAGDVSLVSGGINGMYYSLDADGHYITLLESKNDTTVIVWSTFDKQGNQAWIYAVGQLINGRSIGETEAFINQGGALLENGNQLPANPTPWGFITVNFETCNRGKVFYESVLMINLEVDNSI
ncbi:MAG: hypothetical protein K0U68_13230 [Gammaproteobacteria bacterium]|nr:hypothetical protein [Gammaproteobacteria bacterium]